MVRETPDGGPSAIGRRVLWRGPRARGTGDGALCGYLHFFISGFLFVPFFTQRWCAMWPIREVSARLVEVRSVGYRGPDLLTLSSSHFDPQETLTSIWREW